MWRPASSHEIPVYDSICAADIYVTLNIDIAINHVSYQGQLLRVMCASHITITGVIVVDSFSLLVISEKQQIKTETNTMFHVIICGSFYNK